MTQGATLYRFGTIAAAVALALGALWLPGAALAIVLLLSVPLLAAFFSFLHEPNWKNPALWALGAVAIVFLLRGVLFS